MERMPSIELAIKNEKTEMNFYLQEANRSQNALAKSVFIELAKDEEEHLNKIHMLHEKLIKDGTWPEQVPIEVKGTNIRNVLDALTSSAASQEEYDLDDENALAKSIEFETKGSHFYAKLAEACSNQAEKDFFIFLSRIEREHQLSVTDSLSYLRDPQAWMTQHERTGLDGAP